VQQAIPERYYRYKKTQNTRLDRLKPRISLSSSAARRRSPRRAAPAGSCRPSTMQPAYKLLIVLVVAAGGPVEGVAGGWWVARWGHRGSGDARKQHWGLASA
jgi:hypothetical protein